LAVNFNFLKLFFTLYQVYLSGLWYKFYYRAPLMGLLLGFC
jgi:hypothetical protein